MKSNLLMIGIGIGLLSCGTASVSTQTVERTIRYQETANLTAASGGTITFSDIEDSRCPEGAQCIWAGNATIGFELKPPTPTPAETQRLTMCLGDCSTLYPQSGFRETDSLEATVAGIKYQLTLQEVNPYPSVNKPIAGKEVYSVKIKIEEIP